MIKDEFEREDKSKGYTYKLEAGDVVVARYSAPITQEGGKYTNYALGVTFEGEDIYLRLTKAQHDQLVKVDEETKEKVDLTGREIVAYEYENQYGKQVGVKVSPKV